MESIIGIDPGASGGIALLGSTATAWKMPETERDLWELFQSLPLENVFAYIELVHSMPRQGVASSFKFGKNYGLLRGMLIASCLPFDEVTPQRWQKLMGCLSRGDKNTTKAKAQQLFPSLKVTHAIADALLIAEYGRRTRNGVLA